jgi:hypothetical protein
MSEPAPFPSKPPDEDADVYCLKCGYNLRGLSGDPRRCPECFGVNWVGEFEVPAELVAKQLHRMESAATICVGCILLIAGIIIQWPPFSDYFRGYHDLHRPDCCSLALLFILPIVWGIAARSYLKGCSYKPAWSRVLLLYHAYGLALSAVVIAVVALGAWLIDYLVTPREVGPPDEQLRLVLPWCWGSVSRWASFGFSHLCIGEPRRG